MEQTMLNQKREGTKTKCSECKYKYICNIKECKQVFKVCVLTDVSDKLKVKPESILKATDKICVMTGIDLISILQSSINAKDWRRMTEKDKHADVYNMLVWFLLREKKYSKNDYTTDDITNLMINAIVAFANFYYGAWRDGEYVYCIRCGKIIPNNKSHNVKYCDDCKGYQADRHKKTIICKDCGEEFDVDARNTRSCRCSVCQIKADRENNRKRVLKYRQKISCNG